MNIGLLTVRDRNFHPNYRLSQAADRLGHRVVLINPYELLAGIYNNQFEFDLSRLEIRPDVILPRQGSPMGDYGLALIRHFVHTGIPLINGLEGVTIARNQFITLQALAAAGLKVPDSFFLTGRKQLSRAVDCLGGYPLILKLVNGMGGDGIVKAETKTEAEQFIDRHLDAGRGVLVQQYIKPAGRQDIRIFVVGGEAAGAMTLSPRTGDFRANIHQKGLARALSLDNVLKKIAVRAAKACCLDIAGIDLIVRKGDHPRVIEANYAPGFNGIEAATGIDIAAKVIRFAVTAANHLTEQI